jgi:hypothetical protein
VLDHLQRKHGIERFPLVGDLLGQCVTVAHRHPGPVCVALGDRHVALDRVDPQHVGPQGRDRLRHQPSGAADVQYLQASQGTACMRVAAEEDWQTMRQVSYTLRVEGVHHFERAIRLPPLVG